MIDGLPPELAQVMFDEWAGVLTRGSIRRSALGDLRALIQQLKDGEFIPKLADEVAQARRNSIIPVK